MTAGTFGNMYRAKPFGEASLNALYRDYKNNAKRRNIIFELTKEEVKNITSLNCYYCGVKPSQYQPNKKSHHFNGYYIHNGIDRLNNSKGYTLDNVVPCCISCNKAKQDKTVVEFMSWVTKIYDHMKGQ